MAAIKFVGTISNDTGGNISMSVLGPGTTQTHAFHHSFNLTLNLSPGTYTITMVGLTNGDFLLQVSGAGLQSIKPVPASQHQKIQGIYTITI
jgi:hypothetical protein